MEGKCMKNILFVFILLALLFSSGCAKEITVESSYEETSVLISKTENPDEEKNKMDRTYDKNNDLEEQSNNSKISNINQSQNEVSDNSISEEKIKKIKDELTQDAMKNIIDQSDTSADLGNVIEQIIYEYPDLSNDKYLLILEVRCKHIDGKYPNEEAVAAGLISNESQRLTIEKAKKIISEQKDYFEITDEFKKIQEYPDYVGGSGVSVTYYYLNGNPNERITLISDNRTIIYSKFSDDKSKLLHQEVLYTFNNKNN